MERKIRSVRLYRFQSHVDTTIEFDEGFNAIIGPSDSGKTAIFRALYWALYNKPSGANYTTYGQKHCFVSITFTDGAEITRGRKGSENYYLLKDAAGNKKEFTGFGTSVPEDIPLLHGMSLVEIDPDNRVSLNMANQLDAPFLLSESGAYRAKAVGKLNGAYIVDATIQDINRDIVTCSSNKKKMVELVETVNESLKQYEFLEEQAKTIQDAEQISHAIKAHLEATSNLASCHAKLQNIEENTKRYATQLAVYSHLDEAGWALDEVKVLFKELEDLRKAEGLLSEYTKAIELTSRRIEQLNPVDLLSVYTERLSKVVASRDFLLGAQSNSQKLDKEISLTIETMKSLENVDEITAVCKRLEGLLSVKLQLSGILNSYTEVGSRMIKGQAHLRQVEQNLQNATLEYNKALRSINDCPLCNQRIPHGHEIQHTVFGGQ